MSMKIGIFAGTFDPIHDGHVEVAKSALRQLELDQLLFMVEQRPWTKKTPVDVAHRRAMVDLVIEQYGDFLQLDVGDERFSIQSTLGKIEKLHPMVQLYFVFGGDVFMHMNHKTWSDLRRLLKHQLVVFERGSIDASAIATHAQSLGVEVKVIPSRHPHHASTNVRLHPHQKDIWVPQSVAQYITDNELY